jgi:NadR type nicotinamide-nucleotide adenylyltransferase
MPLNRIAVVGPESTGKSDLSQALASHYAAPWVPEYAREHLAQLDRPYQEADLWDIAQGQLALEETIAQQAGQWLMVDTNLLVISIWAAFKYGRVDPRISAAMKLDAYALHLLTDIDLPWVEDPLREHPGARQALFDRYHAALVEAKVPFAVIRGQGEARLQAAIRAIEAQGLPA